MRKLKLFFACLLMAVLSIGQMWAGEESYTIAFKSTTTSNDGSQAQTTIANLISNGSDYVSSVTATKCYNGKSGYGIKVGASSGSSSIVLNLSSDGQVKPTRVVINACRYGTDTGNMNVTLNTGSATTKTLTSSLADYECTMDGNTTLTKITIAPTTKRIYVKSVTITYSTGGSSNPTVSVEPKEVDFGTKNIYGGANTSGYIDVAVTGTNLKGDISVALGGSDAEKFSIYPTSFTKASNGGTLRVSYNNPTVGEYSAEVTLSSTEATSVELPISLNVINEAPVEYKKVTAVPADWSGEYLLVCEKDNNYYVYTGIDNQSGGYASGTISDGKMTKPSTAVKLIITALTGNNAGKYSIQVNGGTNNNKYIGKSSDANGVEFSDAAVANQISLSDNVFNIISAGGAYLRFNAANNEMRFRYYKSSTYTSQQPVQLYKKVVSSAVTISDPAEGTGSLTLANGQTAVASGDNIEAGKELTVTATPNSGNHYIGGTIVVKKTSDQSDVTNEVLSGTTLTMPDYPITVSATFTPTYAITKVADGGSIALSYTQGDAEEGYATAGTFVTATATADGSHVFTSISLSNNVENPSISGNVATFTMPASAVTVTAEFAVKQDPSIVVTDGTNPITELDFGSVAKGSTPVAQTFKLSGLNLAQGTLMIASSDDTKFTVSPTNINVDGTLEETTVTVTPVTSVAGPFNDEFIKISGGGLAQADEVMIGLSLTVQETYTAKWYVNGAEQLGSTVTVVEGTELTFPDAPTPAGDCAGTEFMGWLTAPLDEASADEPDGLIKTYTGHTMPAANVNYYAVFAEQVSDGTPAGYSLNASAPAAADGNVIIATKSGNTYYAVGTDQSAHALTLTDGLISSSTSNIIWYLSAGIHDGLYYADGTGNNPNYIHLNKSSFNVTTSTANGELDCISNGDGSYKLKVVNSQNVRYLTYSTSYGVTDNAASATPIYIFKYSAATDPTYSNYVTTCVACSNVSLFEAGETNGTITLKQGTKEVSSVKTCNGAVTLTTNAVAATGYELTNIALSGVANVEVNQAMTEITIPANAEGTLTVTATFAQKNYSIAVETYPENIGATLGGATSTAKYGVEQTISTDEPTGYIFGGWYIYDAEDTEKETDLSEEIFTGTYEGQDLELSASFLMPDKNLVAEAYFDKIYTVNEFAELSKNNNETYYIEGLICKINGFYSSKYISYLISVDGVNSGNTVLVYNGSGLNGADFTAASDLSIGDKVIVAGKWSSSNSRINNSKQISYTAAALSALAIVGDASVTTYDVGDSFDKTGLSVTATYNTGYVVTNYDATITSDYDAPTTFTAGVTKVTVSAEEGLISTSRDIPVTVSSAVLDHVEISAAAQTEFWAKEQYKEPLLDAYLTDEPATILHNVTGESNTTGLNMSEPGNKSVTVTYTRKAGQSDDVEYNFTVKPVVVDEAHAHSVATAREIIDVDETDGENLDLALNDTKTHVIGLVKSVSALTGGNAGKYTIVIKDQTDAAKEMTLYQVTLKDGITSVAVDDVIKACGNLYYHAQSSKYEITDGQVVAVVRTPNLTVADVAEMEVNFTADLAEADLTIDKDGSEGAITFSCSDAAVTIVDNKLHAAEAGNATVTATITANGIYTEASTTFNVHVIAARTRYAITFDANGATGGSAPEAIANQLEGAPVELPECTYTWAHHGFTGWKVINLSTSAEIEIENNQFTMPAANVKIQAQWEEIATTHIVFNVNGNTETVAAVDVPQAVEYSITQVTDGQNGYEFVGWAESQETEDVEEAIATIESYTPEAGKTSKTLYAVFKRVDVGAEKTDVLTAADLAATSTDYANFSNVSKTSNAVYAGNSAKTSEDAIQMRSNKSTSGIVSTATGGVLKSVKITVANNNSNTIDVYGSNTAYSSASDLYATGSNANQGTKIGSTSSTATIDAEADYKFVGIRSNNGAIYLSSVEITWQPKTTYYTTAPSAVYAVSYALGGGAWQEDEGCDGANVKAGQTFDICESVPVREHYKFVKWQVAGEDVSGTITINAATAITAIWEAKIESNITYKAGTGTGDDAVVGSNEEGAEIVLPSAADKSLSKEGYDFVGWLYGGDLYEAGTTFEMPASAVTFVAQWKKENITKMTLVTDASQLVDGSKVVIAQAEITDDCKTMGKQNTNNRSAVASTVSGNVLSVGEETSEFTLVSLGNNLFAFQASNGNYLYAASSGNNYLREQAAIDGNASWTISIASNGVATIKAQGSNTNNWMRFNSSSTLFSCYGSGQQDIAIYANVTAITDDASISDIGYVEGDVIVVSSGATLTMDAPSAPTSITVKENAVVNVSAATEAGTVIVEKGAKLAIEEGGSVTTDEPLVLYTTLGKGTGTNTNGNAPGSSSEIINAERLNATGDVYLEIELTQDAKASAGWYAFSVPFPVDAMNGVYYGDTKLTNEVGYAIMSHYGELRAKDEYAWKKFRGIMQPGVFYVITVGNTDYKTLRFKKVADEALVASSSVAVSPFPTQTDNNADGAWNGIGNPNLAISNLETPVPTMQFYDHKTNSFIGRSHSVNLVVGSAFFIQYNATTSVSIPVGINAGNGYLAPQRERQMAEEMIYEVQLTNVATGELEDNVFLTAREDATNEYEIGRDVAKLSMGTAKCAQMWIPAYGTKLCAADFQLVNDKAEYPLTLNAPSAGTYSISMVENDAATIYLTYEGSIIWNLSMSAYELTLEKGTTEGYGLLLNAKMPMTPTGVDEVQSDKVQCTKVVIDEHVYILRGGEMYDVTGKAVK